MRVLVLVLALVATAEASPQLPNIYGPYAKCLSRKETLEIAAIPYHHSGMRKPVFDIVVTDRDRAHVHSGRLGKVGDMSTYFEVRKSAGHWRLVPGSVQDAETVRVYSNGIPVN
jgi:hypothetical protein